MELKILHLSDTHGTHNKLTDLPEADILVHSGDFTFSGSRTETYEFFNWLHSLPYKHKIIVPGNHDEFLYNRKPDCFKSNEHYLYNCGVEIEGLKFWGVPLFIKDAIGPKQDKFYNEIPKGTDVLITHAPPHGILDKDGKISYGSKVLLDRVIAVRPALHLFGHVHNAHGTFNDGSTLFSNAAIVDAQYNFFNRPALLTFNR